MEKKRKKKKGELTKCTTKHQSCGKKKKKKRLSASFDLQSTTPLSPTILICFLIGSRPSSLSLSLSLSFCVGLAHLLFLCGITIVFVCVCLCCVQHSLLCIAFESAFEEFFQKLHPSKVHA